MTEYNTVVAIDPGPKPGIAVYSKEPQSFRARCFSTQSEGEDHIAQTLAAVEVPTVVVCEAYNVTERTIKLSRQYAPLEMIGVARYLSRLHNIDFKLQQPAHALRFATDDKLKRVGMYARNDHARDAARHCLYFLVQRNMIDVRMLLDETA